MRETRRHLEFHIVAGSLKGKLIRSPDLGVTRAPLTRVRKSVFDFLNPYLADARYLDLFSGTGSYLFEAVSRGVASATGVELEPKLADAINRQATEFGIADRLVCLSDDVFKTVPALASAGKTFDIVMIAPPQYRRIIDETLALLKQHRVYTPDSLILCQHDTSERSKIEFQGFQILQQRKYGNTTFTILSEDS
ncbi:MAG TPA: RsmD family RNA methyltransferase [candidate division Zixibacteria bacterium]|nr:RsmD family RNA methyltransferase [candidate division Zixibacteria bacterium]